ncbi:MAG: TIGR01906 family membrane protein [Clostridiales bacterium]|jgi:integral membrane protein (TIGR01906 family)|nr:TIGR01906 family membrane protein [Clostridiales bacterium]
MAIKWLVASLSTLCLFVLICCLSIQIPTFNLDFYKKEYVKLNTAENMKMDEGGLLQVTNELLSYMKGTRKDLIVQATVAGQGREFFNQREVSHMADVKNLFAYGFLVRNLSAIIFVLTVAFFGLRAEGNLTIFARAYILGFLGAIACLLILGFIISTDFNKYFTIFHEIFFTNELWVLDPNVDLLINLVPLQFFMDIAKYIAVTFAQLTAGVLFLSYIYLKFFRAG